MICLALISALATGVIAYQLAAKEMRVAAQQKLFSLLESRDSALRRYFDIIRQDVLFHSQSPLVSASIEEFSVAWRQLPPDRAGYLKNLYISKNPYSQGQKDNLLYADDSSQYSEVHKQYHPVFKSLIAARSFYDIILIDPQGNIIYSAEKELDFGTNMYTGPWAVTSLADVFRKVSENARPNLLAYSDFSPYAPSNGKPASFIAAPVFDQKQQYIGALVFQMPINQLNSVMQVTAGMGETGETYLVGSDLLMRSDSRFYTGRSILKTRVDTNSVRDALLGEEGVTTTIDYRGTPVFSAYKPIDFLGVRWAILAEIDEAEILEPVYELNRFITISGVIIAVVITFLGYLLAADLAVPIVAMTDIMNRLANNDLNVNISVTKRQDEVGSMANALEVFKENAIERDHLQQKLSYLAERDSLTGLPNRKYVMDHLSKLIEEYDARSGQIAVMFIDLDGFKQVNDTLGHQVGDQLLKEAATRFSLCIREPDLIARIGGDEFIIILPNISTRQDCNHVADKLLDSLIGSLAITDKTLRIGVSIGIAIYPLHTEHPSMLIKLADDAMYTSKRNGKNTYSFPDNPQGNYSETCASTSFPNEKAQDE
ncbi:MAG: diguanylate cyclase [Amphritea sp.]